MKRHQNPIAKAQQKIEAEGRKHLFRIYSATAIALWRHWDKRTEAINRLFDMSHDIWKECAADHDHSMIQMCETETGIEIQNGDGKSWEDLLYLNGTIPQQMTTAQILYMRQRQLKWIRPQVMACMLIALHRKYGFGFDRCGRIYKQIEDIEAEFGRDPEKLREACYKLTSIDVAKTTTTDRRDRA